MGSPVNDYIADHCNNRLENPSKLIDRLQRYGNYERRALMVPFSRKRNGAPAKTKREPLGRSLRPKLFSWYEVPPIEARVPEQILSHFRIPTPFTDLQDFSLFCATALPGSY